MIKSTNRKRPIAKAETAALPPGVRVVPPPTSASSRKFLSEPDIGTSGGSNTVHFKHLLGVGEQLLVIIDVFPSTDPGGYRIELVPICLEPGQVSTPRIESIPTTSSTRQEAQAHGRTTYDQAIIEARAHAARRCHAKLGQVDDQRSDMRFEIVEVPDWKIKLAQLSRDGEIDGHWIDVVSKKTQSKWLRELLSALTMIPSI